MIQLPRGDDYSSAVQNPLIAFSDDELRACRVEETPLGLPKPYSGGFTITYKLHNAGKGWAVRCFHRDITDLQKRYQAISAFLINHSSRFFVEAKYLPEGIKVNGKGYPIIKMAWLEGEPLNIYLSKNYQDKSKVEGLLSDFVTLVSELEKFGVAHGDLQHGNIIVKNDKLFLIDYDGMYLPELSTLQSNEIGHVNYQHPQRSGKDYNQFVDRFSSIIIYTGLKAITHNPSLWTKYDNSENILFKSQDFADLQSSQLVQQLIGIPEVKPLVERIVGCCHLEFSKVPSLRDFISDNFTYDKNATGTIAISRSQYLILSASNKASILEHLGEKIEVVGRISAQKSNRTRFGKPYVFLNFGVYPQQTFTAVIWSEGISALTAKGLSPTALVGKWVSITGVVGQYGGKPQMTIDLASQIQELQSEVEAQARLKVVPIKQEKKLPPRPSYQPTGDKEADVFTKLYGSIPVSQPSTPKTNAQPTPKSVIKTPTPSPSPTASSTNKPVLQSPKQQPISSPSTSSSNGNTGWVVVIVCAVLGAVVLGSINPGLWIIGLIIGGIIGSFLQGLFKS